MRGPGSCRRRPGPAPRSRRSRRAGRRRRSSPTSSSPSRSSTSAAIVSASTRLPARARAAARPVVWSSSSSSSKPIPRSSPRAAARDVVVLFVTKRSRCPAARSGATASARAGDRLARDVEHPVDVEQNGCHGRRVYSRDAVGHPPARRDRASLLALERPGRPARAEDRRRVSRRCSTSRPRRRSRATQKRRVIAKAGPVCGGRPGRAEPAPKPRTGDRAARRAASEALKVERRRVPTKPTSASRERRLEARSAARRRSGCAGHQTEDARAVEN